MTVSCKSRLMRIAVIAPVALAAILYAVFLSGYLPLGEGLSFAAECIHGGGNGRVLPFVWSVALRTVHGVLPGTEAFRLGIVSALAGVFAVATVEFAVWRFMRCAGEVADFDASEGDSSYGFLPAWAATLAGLSFVFAPGMFRAATHVGPFTVQFALAVIPFAVLAWCDGQARTQNRLYLLALAGVAAGFAFWEGVPGKIALPAAFLMAGLQRVRGEAALSAAFGYYAAGAAFATLFVFDGGFDVPSFPQAADGVLFQFAFLTLMPTLVLYRCVVARRLKDDFMQGVFAGMWGLAVMLAFAVTVLFYRPDYGRAATEFVDGAIGRLEGRKWLVSDGRLDDLLVFRLPKDIHLVTLRRLNDPKYARELAAWVAEAMGATDDDMAVAAELGPTQFLAEWSRHGGMESNCVFLTRLDPMPVKDRSKLRPCGGAWRPEDRKVDASAAAAEWRRAWDRLEPLLAEGEPGAKMIRNWMTVQGNAIGTLLQAEGKDAEAWRVYEFAFTRMEGENLSLLVNMDGMWRRGKAGDGKNGKHASERIRLAMGSVRDGALLRRQLAEGGRMFLPKTERADLKKRISRLRMRGWDTSFGRNLREVQVRLPKIGELRDARRAEELAAIENLVTRAEGASMGTEWVKHLVCGEVALLRGGAWCRQAQVHFRAMIQAGDGETHLAFDKLLAADLALGDHEALENDALLVLRNDVRHPRANAIVGSARLLRGDFASAVRFLKRAVAAGAKTAAVRNDYALALSGAGSHDEAVALIAEVAKDEPKNWHVMDSQAEILAAAGRKDEAAAVRSRAESTAAARGETVAYQKVVEERASRRGRWWKWW